MSRKAIGLAESKSWRIEEISQSTHLGLSRVSALVDNEMLWFESRDAPLSAVPEGIVAPFILPALNRGVKLVLDEPLDRLWLDNIEKLLPIWNNWWGYSLESPIVASRRELLSEPLVTRTGACFTGGADSFYTLLHSRYKIDVLIYIQGYDIGLKDQVRMAAFERSLRTVAEKLSKGSVVIRTNLREHHCFAEVNWERTHGAALAAPAHLLRSHIGRLVVPSTLRYSSFNPWGSHWITDHLWSSGSLVVAHDDSSRSRDEKLRLIAAEPLPQKHLRVCWENRKPHGNCSCCEKCLRTMISLAGADRLSEFSVFDQSVPLSRRLDTMLRVPEHLIKVLARIDRGDLPSDISKALLRLLKRSKKYYHPGRPRYIARQVKWLVGQFMREIPRAFCRYRLAGSRGGENNLSKG